jgi:hypothetical protein
MFQEPNHHIATTKAQKLKTEDEKMIQKYFAEKKHLTEKGFSSIVSMITPKNISIIKSHIPQLGIRSRFAMSAFVGLGALGMKDISYLENVETHQIPKLTDVDRYKSLIDRPLKDLKKDMKKENEMKKISLAI